jgi:hypothetical protein
MTQEELDAALEDATVLQCAACGKLSAFAWSLCDAYPDGEAIFRGMPLPADKIAHIGCSSAYEWECGHCQATNVDPDSPTLASCYTHWDD